MIHHFPTVLLNPDGNYKLQEINGAKNILIHAEKETYEYEEIIEIADNAFYTERRRYGWTIMVTDRDGQLKELFTQGSTVETCIYTTRSSQTVQEWIDKLYDKDVKQVSLF
ncbi:hypothetical protein ACO1PF_00605 [Alkalibacterium sp. f15]|uniref:hypothetical protein n=1 Tax=Alkalibacterium sp. f15 TaxID=3414029 RepID=UPI003BF842AD